ncbi:MAG: DUF5312 family protein [Treponemataceae bacterium]
MEYKESTFDELVKKLSTDEARTMLDSIRKSVDATSYDFDNVENKLTSGFSKNLTERSSISSEPFFLRIFLYIVAFFKSKSVQAVHNDYLLRQLAGELKRIARDFYSPPTNTFTSKFYQSLKELRRTQLFFSGLLQAYDSEKGQFYIIISSFIAPKIYEALLKKTDPTSYSVSEDSVVNTRAKYSRDVDTILNQLSESQKTELYNSAKAIEWIKNLCDASVDKALLQFTGAGETLVCVASSILSEMQVLASVLNSARKIPDEVLQTLFLLYNEENIAINSEELEIQSQKFKEEAISALKAIDQFISIIPLTQILRYVARDISWCPTKFEAGEDWYIFFKHAWKERLSKKWDSFVQEQEKTKLVEDMLSTLEVDEILPLAFQPWEEIRLKHKFKKQLSIEFMKTLFKHLVPNFIEVLNVIFKNGKFVKKENQAEFNETFAELKQFSDFLLSFENMFSPEGELGLSFANLKKEKLVGLTFKKQLDTIFKSIESNSRQLHSNCIKIFRSLYALLTGILSANRKGLYATLTNLDKINGNRTEEYIEQLNKVFRQTSKILTILESLDKIEK